jgi:hypothetical protein
MNLHCSVLALFVLTPLAIAQSPQFVYRTLDQLTIDRRHNTEAICVDSVGGAPVTHTDSLVVNPAARIGQGALTTAGGKVNPNWVEFASPTVAVTHQAPADACDQGIMNADANRNGAARIKATATNILMTTVDESVDTVEVVGLGCGGGSPLGLLVEGQSKTRSTNTVTSTTPFGLRDAACLRIDSLFTFLSASVFGPASAFTSKAQSRIEIFQDVNRSGAFEAGIDVSVYFQQGQQLVIDQNDPASPRQDLVGSTEVILQPGRYIAIYTFDHDFSVSTVGNFSLMRGWNVDAGDDARGSVSLSLRPIPVVQPQPQAGGVIGQ